MNENDIKEFLDKHDYDLRKRHRDNVRNLRWMDQKCTPDVVWSVSDIILNYIEDNGDDVVFTVKDIWHSEYANMFICEEFSKPDITSPSVENEFDKFFGYQLNLLEYAGIVKDNAKKKENINMLLLRLLITEDTKLLLIQNIL